MKRLNDQFKYFMQNRSKKIMLKFVSHLNIIKSTNQIWDWHMQSKRKLFFWYLSICKSMVNSFWSLNFNEGLTCVNRICYIIPIAHLRNTKSPGHVMYIMKMALSKRIALCNQLYNHWIYSDFWLLDFKKCLNVHTDRKKIVRGLN